MTLLRILCVALPLQGCATSGGWMGAAAELEYERALDHRRMVAVRNNEDYYEHHLNGRIYVLAEADDLRDWIQRRQARQTLTVRGGGPRGETLVFAVARPENFKPQGFGAVEMYYGRRRGQSRDFYAEIYRDGTYYLFDDWQSLDDFRFTGRFKTAATERAGDGHLLRMTSNNSALKQRFFRLRRESVRDHR